MSRRCQGCPVAPGLACYVLVSGLDHLCIQSENDPALVAYIVAESKPGCEPDRRPPHRSGKPYVDLGVDQHPKQTAKG